jgi:hypothetical protein
MPALAAATTISIPLTKNMGAATTGTLNEEIAFVSMLTDIKFQREGP